MKLLRPSLQIGNLGALLLVLGCTHSQTDMPLAVELERYEAPPEWMKTLTSPEGQLCTIGIAGPGTTADGPSELSRIRAVDALALSIETLVWEGIIDKERNGVASVQAEAVVGTSGELISQLRESATATWWFDALGEGYVGLPNYTYARVCTDQVVGKTELLNSSEHSGLYANLEGGPTWLAKGGSRANGRICAVGQSRRTYDPSDALEQAAEDVRAQLATSLEALVSSLSEERQTTTSLQVQSTTVGLNLGEVKGAVVQHQWFDRVGSGPLKEKGAAYAWGCVFPEIEFERTRRAVLEEGQVDQAEAFERARNNARAFFESMELEEKNRAGDAPGP